MLKQSVVFCASLWFFVGCAHYTTPGRGAALTEIAPQAAVATTTTLGGPAAPKPVDPIAEAFERKPLATFPAAVAVARVQAAGYRSRTASGWGEGSFCIVTTRDVEQPAQIERLARLPQLKGIAPINRLLIQGTLDSDVPLRRAAAQLQADLLLVYTFDTVFTTEDKAVPLSVISLGLSPNSQVRVTSTASALLLDTRNGYVYGLAEATEQQKRLTNAWQSDVAADETRRSTESAAFEKLVGELEQTWSGVVSTYARAK